MGKKIRLLLVSCACALGVVAIIAGPAGAATAVAPVVETFGTSSVTATSGVVFGGIAPNGYTVYYEFQYGTTAKFGLTTPVTTIPAQSGAVTVSATLSGLKAKTKYYYRLVGTTDTFYNGYYYYPGTYYYDNGTGTFTTKAAAKKGSVTLSGKTVKVKGHDADLKLKCASSSRCRGSVTLYTTVRVKKKKHSKKIGSAHFSISANHKGTVKIKLSSAELSTLRGAKGHKAKATATAKPSSGQKGFKNKGVTLKS